MKRQYSDDPIADREELTWAEKRGYAAIDLLMNVIYLGGLLGIVLWTLFGGRWDALTELVASILYWPLLPFLPMTVNWMLPLTVLLTLSVGVVSICIQKWIEWYNESVEAAHSGSS